MHVHQPDDVSQVESAASNIAAASANDCDQHFDAVEQFLAALHATRADGLPAWTADGDVDATATRYAAVRHRESLSELLAAAVVTAPERAAELRKLLKLATRRDGRPTTERRGIPSPMAAYHSEASRLSVLRTDWSASAAELAVDWSRPELRIEFAVGKRRLLAGLSAPEVRVGGKLLAVRGSWEEVCWESNVDVDYLEIEIALEAGARLQRQFVLTRRDGLLYVAEAVLLAVPGNVSVAVRLPLAEEVESALAAETREIRLATGKLQTLVLPPLCGEWRSEKRGGDLTVENDELCVTADMPGAAAVYAPLVIVYDSARAKRECTWRRLTVGEDLQLVSADRAAGFRIQLGKEHWLGYRSLTERANRTVLGVNLQTNFLLSRFTTDGESEPLVEIDH
ncbi:MAG: hypothetical protein QM775_02775 [Pirellulales bacterium]